MEAMEKVRVYILDIKTVAAKEGEFDLCLTEEDAERKGRYRMKEDALRFLGGRYLIHRFIPGTIEFGEYKKPFIDGAPSFSLSHAGDKIVLGIASEGSIGVDIEGHRNHSAEGLINRVCTEYEKEKIGNESDFYRCWTRKEALMKLTGKGLGIEPKRIETVKDWPYITFEGQRFHAKTLQIGDLWLSVCLDVAFEDIELVDVD